MSGPFGASQWMYNPSSSFYPHSIDQSLRFSAASSAHLSRTPTSTGNQKTWTFNTWIKLGNMPVASGSFRTGALFSAGSGVFNKRVEIQYYVSGKLYIIIDQRLDGGTYYILHGNADFRDVSGWYMFTVIVDTTQATASDRIRLYANGTRLTDLTNTNGYPAQNSNLYVNTNGLTNYVGETHHNSEDYRLDGSLAETIFIDGSALGPDSFGETKDGIWVPKDTSGLTFGTNGFHLDFADSSAIGNDVSGEDNDWTPSGLAATDVVPDSPTNNFAVLNNLIKGTHTFSEGNLQATSATAWNTTLSTVAPTSGKWYFESVVKTKSWQMVGFEQYTIADNVHLGATSGTKGMAFVFDPSNTRSDVSYNGTNTVYNTGVYPLAVGDIISIALDLDNNNVKFYLNNSMKYDISNALETGAAYAFGFSCFGSTMIANFGQDSSFAGNKTSGSAGASDANGQGDFFYAPLSGFLALCSSNLPEPAIISGEDYFNTVLWTGNDADDRSIGGVGFQPDWTWIKQRSAPDRSHLLVDSVRGATERIKSDINDLQDTFADGVQVFESDGFQIGTNNTVNASPETYVAWNWLAGTAVSGATTGLGTAKTYTGSVNTEAGFSIIKYVGNGTSGHTIPHNLTVDGVATTPTIIMVKRLDAAGGWRVQHKDVAATHYLALDTNAGKADLATIFNDTAFNSTVFTVGSAASINSDDADSSYIAYCFTDIEGFSKAGMYIGNSSADGTYVHTGFKVSWLMVKDRDNTGSWYIWDDKRSTHNEMNDRLVADLPASEVVDREVDFLSNGFKLRESNNAHNTNGREYIYLAFAEQPFKYANAR